MKKTRCAIYTRKSSEDGLEQEFNSLDAQREACAAYITSQKHEGWILLPGLYDDGGLSGGSLDRPALQKLLLDIREGLVDQIIVYKIDRLTRSLADFSKIVDILDAAEASFVSVTQSFNTATSMGRLILKMLLSFAQFEREVTAERIRDKIAASKRKGLWMGGNVPMGYDPDGRTLKINQLEAQTIQVLFDLYEQRGTIRSVKEEAGSLNLRTGRRETSTGKVTGGGPFDRGHIHHILTNPIYAGRIRHRKAIHEGQHDAIIDPDRWECIQQQLQNGAARTRAKIAAKQRSLLCGKLFDETGDRLTPSHSKTRRGLRLRYYISHRLVKRSGEKDLNGWRLPAEELETRIARLLRSHVSSPLFFGTVVPEATVSDIRSWRVTLSEICQHKQPVELFDLIERVEIAPGELRVDLDGTRIAEVLSIKQDALDQKSMFITSVFQLRKRGVETKLIFADAATGVNERLIRNIAKAHNWFEQIKSGKTLSEIARTEQTSNRRLQQMIGLAFLAPDILRNILDGRQPLGFTSDWCMRHALPVDWNEQRELLATL